MRPAVPLSRFLHSEEGSILTFWGVSLTVLLGFLALSFDLGRMSITHTDLQSYADSVALAAAGELDGTPDAIIRATAAAAEMIRDQQTFGDADRTLSGPADYSLTFLSSLPSLDTLAATAITTDPLVARFVLVDITVHSVSMTYGAAFRALRGEANNPTDLGAIAVAGFTQMACDISSMMMCIPSGFDPDLEVGTVVQLRSGGGTSGQWGPGNYGFLSPLAGATLADPAGHCAGFPASAQEWCVLAAQRPVTTCYDAASVDTRPGQSVGRMAAALNTRFDIYEGVLNSYRNNPAFGPAPNVISGNRITTRGGGQTPQCHMEQADPTHPTFTVPLPADDCFDTGSCPRGRYGNAEFAAGYAEYVSTNYGAAPSWFPSYPTTRYQIYLDEIANSTDGRVLTGRQETGGAVCNAANRSTDPERRVLLIAGINCGIHNINGNAVGVPVDTWVRVFLLQPADTTTKEVFVEVLGSARGEGAAGVLRDVVRLYR